MVKSLFIATALVAAAGVASAASSYKVWFDIANAPLGVQVGDITLGNAKYVPPAWACGRRIVDPDTYAWRGQTGSVIDDGNFTESVNVWMGLPGCGKPLAVAKVSNGSVYTPPEGRHYMQIYGATASLWIDKNGTWPSCMGCVVPGGFKALSADLDWDAAAMVLGAAQEGVLGGSAGALQARLRLDDAAQRIQSLASRAAQAVTERRRASFGTLETSVRALEDAALAALAQAAEQQARCRSHWEAARPADGAVACSGAQDAVQLARRALQSVVDEVH